MDQRIIKQKRIKKLVLYSLFTVTYVVLFALLVRNSTSGRIQRVLAPILFVYTIALFGASIAILWKRQKTVWGRVMVGHGCLMLIYILFRISTFTRAVPMSGFWQLENTVFMVALLACLIIYMAKKVLKPRVQVLEWSML